MGSDILVSDYHAPNTGGAVTGEWSEAAQIVGGNDDVVTAVVQVDADGEGIHVTESTRPREESDRCSR
jgi:hypothetical protein